MVSKGTYAGTLNFNTSQLGTHVFDDRLFAFETVFNWKNEQKWYLAGKHIHSRMNIPMLLADEHRP